MLPVRSVLLVPQDRKERQDRKVLPDPRLPADRDPPVKSARPALQGNRLPALKDRQDKSDLRVPQVPRVSPVPRGNRLPAPRDRREPSEQPVPLDKSVRRDKALQAPKDRQDPRDPPGPLAVQQDLPDRSAPRDLPQGLSARPAQPDPPDKSAPPVLRVRSVRPVRLEPQVLRAK